LQYIAANADKGLAVSGVVGDEIVLVEQGIRFRVEKFAAARAYSELVRTPKQRPLSLWERVRVRAFAFKQSTAIPNTL
jgi:hypothetical protein